MASEQQKAKNVKAFEAALGANLNGKVHLSNTYSLARIKANADQWYFGVKCERCKGSTPALPDESKGKRKNPFTGDGKIKVNCYYCSNEISAGSDEIISFQFQLM